MYTRERETFQYGWFTGYPFSKGSARCELRTPDLLFPFAISNFMKILLFYGTSHRNRQVFARVTACNMKFEDFAWKYLSPVQDFNVFFIRLLVIGKRSRNTGNAFLGFYWKFSLLIEHTLTLEEGHASDMTVVDRMKRADEKSAIFLQVKSILAERLKARADNARELGGLIATRYPSFFLPLPTLSLSLCLSVCLSVSATFSLCTIREGNTVAAMFRYFFHFATSERCSFYGKWIWYCLEERVEIGADEGKWRFDEETYNA